MINLPTSHGPGFVRVGVAWLLLATLAFSGAYGWWAAGRPVALPDAPSNRIACVSYAPFRKPGETPLDPNAYVSPERIDEDLRLLSQRVDCVRTYSQGQGLSAVPRIAKRYGMQVLLGIWLGRDDTANARQVELGIATARQYPQVVRGVIVGNEVLLRKELTTAQLAVYLRRVRQALDAPVSYADVWEFWLAHRELAASVDYVTIHILPYWEDAPVSPDHAVEHVAAVYARVQRAFPGKTVMIGETGWPSAGRPRQAATASVVNQARYLREFLRYAASVKMPYNVIEAFDQPWKRAQEGTVGGYWGIYDAHAQPKFPMRGPVTEVPRWWLGWLAGALGALLFVGAGAWRRRWRGWRGVLVLGLAGFGSGCALAWQGRQMIYACRDLWEWTVSVGACVLALFTAFSLARWLAARMSGEMRIDVASRRWRLGWLFALAYYGLLLVFDGRYRDFPLGLFMLPCVGYALLGWLTVRSEQTMPLLEECFLAVWLPLLALIVLAQEAWLTPAAWLWLGLNLALALPVAADAVRVRRLNSQQA